MIELYKEILTPYEKERLYTNLKIGIYKELYSKNLLTDYQLSLLLEKHLEVGGGNK